MARLAAVLALLAGGPQGGITWLRLDDAKVLSNKNAKLVLVFVACDPGTGMSS
jgi:hypothetical protein